MMDKKEIAEMSTEINTSGFDSAYAKRQGESAGVTHIHRKVKEEERSAAS
jgi:hypothetical protein